MVADHHYHRLEAVRAALSVVVYPVQYVVNLPVVAARTLFESAVARRNLVEDNERLRAQNLLLKTRLQKYAALETENMRLRELLESSMEVGERVLVADLLGFKMNPSARQVVLDKGSRHGVFLGQPVVDSDGVMGQIVHLGPFTSVAMLVTDPDHAMPVRINRNGVRAIAVGTTDESILELNYVPVSADVKVGDLIVSSGLGGRFPAGYPVAEVTEVAIDPAAAFARIKAAPRAKLSRSQQVLLLWPEKTTAAVAEVPAGDGTAR